MGVSASKNIIQMGVQRHIDFNLGVLDMKICNIHWFKQHLICNKPTITRTNPALIIGGHGNTETQPLLVSTHVFFSFFEKRENTQLFTYS